jgi:hypothetical protein
MEGGSLEKADAVRWSGCPDERGLSILGKACLMVSGTRAQEAFRRMRLVARGVQQQEEKAFPRLRKEGSMRADGLIGHSGKHF